MGGDVVSVGVTMCPRCRRMHYDVRLGRCLYCGYSTWSVGWRYGVVKTFFLASLAMIVVISLVGWWIGPPQPQWFPALVLLTGGFFTALVFVLFEGER